MQTVTLKTFVFNLTYLFSRQSRGSSKVCCHFSVSDCT